MAFTRRRSAPLTVALLAVSGLVVGACAGPAFTTADPNSKGGSGGDAGANSSASGGAVPATGGRNQTGGAPAGSGAHSGGTLASASGGTRAGGALGLGGQGGLGLGGLLGTGGVPTTSFPSTKRLDEFSRDDGELGSSWVGATDEFTIRNEQLQDLTGAGQPLLWDREFGANQEVFATLVSFAAQAREINLILKAQVPGSPCDLIEVLYKPDRSQVGVDFCANGDWTELPGFAVALAPGDQLGARVNASGKLLVYRNGTVITTFDASVFPHKTGGYIGVNALSSADDPATWDDFGGGNATP